MSDEVRGQMVVVHDGHRTLVGRLSKRPSQAVARVRIVPADELARDFNSLEQYLNSLEQDDAELKAEAGRLANELMHVDMKMALISDRLDGVEDGDRRAGPRVPAPPQRDGRGEAHEPGS